VVPPYDGLDLSEIQLPGIPYHQFHIIVSAGNQSIEGFPEVSLIGGNPRCPVHFGG